ncbi:hypothetical protein BD626DRAFT_498916, partial [Schizophyllum amplum]
MFSLYQPSPYYPLPTAHHPIQPLSPRDKYLAAVAEAEAARASYLADEAARQEEEALERRLEELRMRRSSTGLLQPYGPDLRARHLSIFVERARLARVLEEERLRIRLEEQEHMRKEAALSRVRQQQTIHACSRRHSPSSSGLASKFDRPSSARKADSRLHHDYFLAGFLEALAGQASPPKTQTAARHDEPSKAVDVQDVLSRLFGIPAAKPQDDAHVPCCSAFGQPPANSELGADAVADLASQFLGTSVDPKQVKNAIDVLCLRLSSTGSSAPQAASTTFVRTPRVSKVRENLLPAVVLVTDM